MIFGGRIFLQTMRKEDEIYKRIYKNNKGIEAMKTASRIAEENGIADMTLEEINAEIAEARKMLNS